MINNTRLKPSLKVEELKELAKNVASSQELPSGGITIDPNTMVAVNGDILVLPLIQTGGNSFVQMNQGKASWNLQDRSFVTPNAKPEAFGIIYFEGFQQFKLLANSLQQEVEKHGLRVLAPKVRMVKPTIDEYLQVCIVEC
jgi:hypothetical protein